ncbi:MAG: hypothetical protein HC841_00125 [Verrucomicrobiae bacterium]|nr:hypothetical protein [Verrucomicrobiae bacterium]
MIAALYVLRDGPYWNLDGVDAWDVNRDKAWDHPNGCACGAGDRCPDCNAGDVPEFMPDTRIICDDPRRIVRWFLRPERE